MLTVEQVSKRYGETAALTDVSIAFAPGHVHTILGENGSGKSTVVKLLSGIVAPDRGEIRVDGRAVLIRSPAEARTLGIATVFQEVLLAPDRTVLENIFMGYDALLRRRIGPAERAPAAAAALARISRTPPPLDARAGAVPLAQQQLIVLARALVRDPRILVLDEVTAALDFGDRDVLFAAVEAFAAEGRLAIFISHRMDEVLRLSDRVTVLRSGRVTETLEGDEITSRRLLRLMLPDVELALEHG